VSSRHLNCAILLGASLLALFAFIYCRGSVLSFFVPIFVQSMGFMVYGRDIFLILVPLSILDLVLRQQIHPPSIGILVTNLPNFGDSFGVILLGDSTMSYPRFLSFELFLMLFAFWQLLSFFFPLRSTASQFIKEWGGLQDIRLRRLMVRILLR
jgi:hypothetical protein